MLSFLSFDRVCASGPAIGHIAALWRGTDD
jgi:hypothetical protein